MEKKYLEENIDFILNKQREILLERSKSYVTEKGEREDKNYLDNFYDTSNVCNILGINVNPSEVAFILFVLKLCREKTQRNEVIGNYCEVLGDVDRFDSIVDAMNYFLLYTMCETERTTLVAIQQDRENRRRESINEI